LENKPHELLYDRVNLLETIIERNQVENARKMEDVEREVKEEIGRGQEVERD